MAIGGFNGSDPAPTLAQFQDVVADGEIHYFIAGGGSAAVRRPAAAAARAPRSPRGSRRPSPRPRRRHHLYDLTERMSAPYEAAAEAVATADARHRDPGLQRGGRPRGVGARSSTTWRRCRGATG